MREAGSIVDGRYRLERVLGEGGHAVVWGATQILTQKRVALKVFKEHGPRNLLEARAATQIDHPHVIRVHDVFADESGGFIMVMDWLEGESLAQKLARDRTIPLPRVIDMFLPVLEAIERAHRSGIVHRDLKPSNLFVTTDEHGNEKLVLLDFGVAKVLGEALGETAHTASGTLLGTPHYMAPEQMFGESNADARVDLWSIGIVLSECLTGKRPTDAPNVGGVLKRVTTRDITKLRALDPSLPPAILEHVDALLAFEPSSRPASIAETARVLTAVRDGSTEAPRRRSTTRWVSAAAAAGALALLATLAIAARGTSRPAPLTSRPAEPPHPAPPVSLAAEPDVAEASSARPTPSSSPAHASASARAIESRPPKVERPTGIIERNPYR